MPSLSGIQCGVMWVSTDVNNCGEAAMGPYCNGDKQQGVFCQGFFWVKFGGGRIGGGGGVFIAGSFAGFGQRVRIGVWPGR